MRIFTSAVLSGVLAWSAVDEPAHAQADARDTGDLKLFRFELDNDIFVRSDDAFTAGWSVQLHSPLLDEWPPGLGGWIGRVPGLDDDGAGGRVVRRAWGITQLIITPGNITIARPQPNDAPWAGMLGAYVSWSAYDNDRLAALQAYVGCVGSCSHAEEVQKLMHNSFGFGDEPRGWPNQLADRPLLNLNYEYRHKLWARADFDPRGWSQDLSAGGQVGLGSFATYAQAWLEYRFGWDVPEGFTNLSDPPALGVALDPTYVEPGVPARPRTWRPYFSVVARVRALDRFAPLLGGETDNGGFHPAIESAPGDKQVLVGIHVARVPLAFHLTYYRFFGDDDFAARTGGELDWVNFSFERRFARRTVRAPRG
ncbi:MAG TPA: lipid A deacylase LpxR family protein [Gammaproteobacteria bacterium]|nr:lipid A deacylase LpxR family protein [Gammaproteobacteria bacterium]